MPSEDDKKDRLVERSLDSGDVELNGTAGWQLSPDDTEEIKQIRVVSQIAAFHRERVSDRMDPPSEVPDDIGHYHILEKLGEGGMGAVYLAEQRQPIHRRVAIKVIKLGMDTKEVIARFESERQALAMMAHPNIARVFDAGTTTSGRPYFAMEYVQGIPINDYCDRNKLTIEERLRLFVSACQAVHHAHQQGIIHRDLKPSNILVSVEDSAAVVKVIDFGVAKATNQRLTERTVYTEQGRMIGTPEYMSPEQAEMSGLGVDTTTDVYSLGVMLYELLTGVLPFDPRTLRHAGLEEIHRIIRDSEPAKPSARLSGQTKEVTDLARRRRSEPATLRRQIHGELDWITMRAMEKDRTRRYPSASELAADVGRYLENEPVVAGPPSGAYKLRKFARRNRAAVATAAGFVGLLAVGFVAVLSMYVRANDAQVEARWQSYTANIHAASEALRAHDAGGAREALLRCPTDLRQWEWKLLRSRSDASLEVISTKATMLSMGMGGDDRCVYAAGRDTIGIWDLKTGRRLNGWSAADFGYQASPFWGQFSCLLDLHRGRMLTWSYTDLVLDIRGYPDGRLLRRLQPAPESEKPDRYLGVAVQPTGDLIAAGSTSGRIYLWDGISGKCLCTLAGGSDPISDISFVPRTDLLVTRGTTGNVSVWRIPNGRKVYGLTPPEPIAHELIIVEGIRLAVNPSGDLIAAAGGSNIYVWDVTTGTRIAILKGHEDSVTGIAFSPDGRRLVSTSKDATIRVWNTFTCELAATLEGHTSAIYGYIQFDESGERFWTCDQEGTFRAWSAQARNGGDGIRIIPAQSLAVPKEGGWVFALQDWGVTGWDSLYNSRNFYWPGRHCSSLACRDDGKVVAVGSESGEVRIWDVSSGEERSTFVAHAGPVSALVFSPSGDQIASADGMGSRIETWHYANRNVRCWDSKSGKLIYDLGSIETEIPGLLFSPDGQMLATAGESGVRLWTAASGKLLRSIRSDDARCQAIAFSPTARVIITATGDGFISAWNAQSGKPVATVRTAMSYPSRLAVSEDGRRLLVSDFGFTNSIAVLDMERLAPIVSLHDFGDVAGRMLPGGRLAVRRDAMVTFLDPLVPKNGFEKDRASHLNDRCWDYLATEDNEIGVYVRTLRCAKEAVRLDPDNPDILQTLGIAYYRLAQYGEAKEALERSDQLWTPSPGDSIPDWILAPLVATSALYGRQGDALAVYDRLVHNPHFDPTRLAPSSSVFLERAERLLGVPVGRRVSARAPGRRMIPF